MNTVKIKINEWGQTLDATPEAVTAAITSAKETISLFGCDCPAGRGASQLRRAAREAVEVLMPGAGFMVQRAAFPGL